MASPWYCDFVNGDNTTGDGSSGNPWKTLYYALDSAGGNVVGGETVYVADSGAEVLTTPILIDNAPTAAAPIVIRGDWTQDAVITIPHPDGDLVAAKLDGNNAVASIFAGTKRSYVVYYRMIFANSTSFLIESSTSNIFIQCEFTDAGGSQMVDTGAGCTYIDCWFHDPKVATTEPMRMGSPGCRAIHCTFQDDGATSQALLNHSGNYSSIIDCLFINPNQTAIRLNAYGTLVMGNTMFAKTGTTGSGVEVQGNGDLAMFLNNILYDFDASTKGGIDLGDLEYGQIYGWNHFFENAANYINKAAARSALDLSANDQSTDPTFVDAANQDFACGTNAKEKAWPKGFIGTSTGANTGTLTYEDTGCAQRQEPAGGGTTVNVIKKVKRVR